MMNVSSTGHVTVTRERAHTIRKCLGFSTTPSFIDHFIYLKLDVYFVEVNKMQFQFCSFTASYKSTSCFIDHFIIAVNSSWFIDGILFWK